MKKLIKSLWFTLMVVSLASCATLRKAELASGDEPQHAIPEVEQIMTAAQQDQIDVLAAEQYTKGRQYLKDAKRGVKQGEAKEKILENAAIAKALFEDARETARAREGSATRILSARKSALDAGVRKSEALVERLVDIDDDLKSETKQFSRALSPKDFSAFQKKYLALEVKAVQFSQLSNAKQAIAKADDEDADDLAPASLRAAELDYATAMNMIAQSPRNPDLYYKSVDAALASATTLVDVMDVIKGAKGTPENIALQIVKQKRALGELSSSVGKLEASLKTTKQTLEEKEGKLKQTEGVLKTQEAQLARASTQVRFQQAMDEAQQEISPDDALVYQQGNRLVFRLKRINFKSGTSVIPEFSKLLLAKVNAIIKKLDAEKVIVQGHTDSVGSTKVNQRLSTARAKAVATYLYSFKGGYKITYAGYGESHPIASNDTAAGRATNRRVDLVVSVKQ